MPGNSEHKVSAIGGGVLHRLDHLGVGVAEDHRPPGTDVIDICLAVFVPDSGARATLEKHWRTADRAESPNRRIDAAGDELE